MIVGRRQWRRINIAYVATYGERQFYPTWWGSIPTCWDGVTTIHHIFFSKVMFP